MFMPEETVNSTPTIQPEKAPNIFWRRLKLFSGIAWFVFFILLLLIATIYYNPKILTFPRLPEFNLKDILTPKTVIKRELVQEESSVIAVVDKVSPSVVSIIIKTINFDYFSGPQSTEEGIGTGFIVDKNGIIVTNSHVVEQEGDYSVVLKDGSTYDVNKIHKDPSTDLAILEIKAKNLPAVILGDSDGIRVGQRAIAIGNALGRFQNTVTAGVISGIARQLTASGVAGDVKTYENAIQTDAALNPGNSGGPLLNSFGQVIGINVATTRGANNISFAIPVNTLTPILESFLKVGRIVRPYMGVSYTMVSKEIAAIRRLPEGAFISRILSDSPAQKAGILRGDIVTKFDGKNLSSDLSLSAAIAKKKVGDTLSIQIDRDGKQVELKVTLEEAPEL